MTKEELNKLKEEYDSFMDEAHGLSEEELKMVTGGFSFVVPENDPHYEMNIYPGVNPEEAKDNFEKKF